jgi:hypothetical protein
MEPITLGDGLGRRRRRRHKGMGALPTLVGRKRRGKHRRKGRKICIRTAGGKKVCGTRWRKRRRR